MRKLTDSGDDGQELLAMESKIDPDKIGDLWSAFITTAGPIAAGKAEEDFEASA